MKPIAARVDCVVWIALSAQGYPCPFIGFAFTRKALKDSYAKRFQISDFGEAGYRAVKVRMTEVVP